jgi:hypothetical protein
MSADVSEDHDAVGYGQPPKRTQFKPGQSGNPKGRPKGAKNLATRIEEVLSLPVKITQGKRQKWVRTDFAMLLRMREKALNGDLRASERLLGLRMASPEQPGQNAPATSAEDEAILADYEAEILARAAEKFKPRARCGRRK